MKIIKAVLVKKTMYGLSHFHADPEYRPKSVGSGA
jgi:hypothetical protein